MSTQIVKKINDRQEWYADNWKYTKNNAIFMWFTTKQHDVAAARVVADEAYAMVATASTEKEIRAANAKVNEAKSALIEANGALMEAMREREVAIKRGTPMMRRDMKRDQERRQNVMRGGELNDALDNNVKDATKMIENATKMIEDARKELDESFRGSYYILDQLRKVNDNMDIQSNTEYNELIKTLMNDNEIKSRSAIILKKYNKTPETLNNYIIELTIKKNTVLNCIDYESFTHNEVDDYCIIFIYLIINSMLGTPNIPSMVGALPMVGSQPMIFSGDRYMWYTPINHNLVYAQMMFTYTEIPIVHIDQYNSRGEPRTGPDECVVVKHNNIIKHMNSKNRKSIEIIHSIIKTTYPKIYDVLNASILMALKKNTQNPRNKR